MILLPKAFPLFLEIGYELVVNPTYHTSTQTNLKQQPYSSFITLYQNRQLSVSTRRTCLFYSFFGVNPVMYTLTIS